MENTKQDLILSIAKIGNEISVNEFVKVVHTSFIEGDITHEEFMSIMNQAIALLRKQGVLH
jgi:hypothetical protein